MSLTGSRIEAYRFALVSRTGLFLGALEGVTGGTVERDVFSELRSGGRLSVAGVEDRDWLDARVRVTYLDGDDEYVVGTFIVATPSRETDGARTTRELELYSPLLVLSQDKVVTSYMVAAGANVVDAVRTVIEEAGEQTPTITDSAEVLAAARVWPSGTPRLRIVNDLLDSINYFSIDVDSNGRAYAYPYVEPSKRAVVWTFADDENGLHKRNVKVGADYFAIPNRVVLVVSNADSGELIGVAEDNDSDYGYAKRGRWVTDHRSEQEATTLDVLEAKAARILVEGRQVSETVEVRHPWLPFDPSDVVAFRDAAADVDATFVVVKQSHTLMQPGACVASTLRRVTA